MIEKLRMPDEFDIKVRKCKENTDVYEIIFIEYFDKEIENNVILQERMRNTKKAMKLMLPDARIENGDNHVKMVYSASKDSIMNMLAMEFLFCTKLGSLSLKDLFLAFMMKHAEQETESARHKFMKKIKDINEGKTDLTKTPPCGVSGMLEGSSDNKKEKEKV